MHDHIIKEELSSITLPTTPIIIKQASLEHVSVHYKFPRYEDEMTTYRKFHQHCSWNVINFFNYSIPTAQK